MTLRSIFGTNPSRHCQIWMPVSRRNSRFVRYVCYHLSSQAVFPDILMLRQASSPEPMYAIQSAFCPQNNLRVWCSSHFFLFLTPNFTPRTCSYGRLLFCSQSVRDRSQIILIATYGSSRHVSLRSRASLLPDQTQIIPFSPGICP
jgi:hypothetical protein